MKNQHEYINKTMQRYLNNDMSVEEAHEFEIQCAQDPFMQDMLDGIRENNVAATELEALNQQSPKTTKNNHFNGRNKWLLYVNILFLTALLLITLTYLLPQFGEKITSEEVAQSNQNPKTKLQSVPVKSKAENSSSQQIKEDQQKIKQAQPQQKAKTSKSVLSQKQDDPTADNTKKDANLPLEKMPKKKAQLPEVIQERSTVKKKVNILYFHNFKVMNFEGIRRDNKVLVTPKKTPGLPASQENKNNPTSQFPQKDKKKIGYNQYLKETITNFSKEWYNRCLKRCVIMLKQYPNDPNAAFYGGMSLLNLNNHKKAIPYFQKVINSPYDIFYEASLFYYAIAWKHVDSDKSQSLFKSIVDQNGFYAERAKKMLTKF